MAGVLQLIDGFGTFNGAGLDDFVKSVDLASCGLSYAVVSIMGPQSSGKSTLLNHLFNTRFTEMNALTGRSQTTQGVWLARASGLEPCTLIMDLEGTDGTERGEDDTAFEKQSSLFALAVSDIVLINMWCHDIGREHAANKPLLKTVFQVMMRLFTPRKTTLLFVIRDKTRTPLEVLEASLRKEVQKIWDSVPKPEAYSETPLTEFFNVKVAALSNFEDKEELFKREVAQLRQSFMNSIKPGGLAGDRRGVVPGTGFSVSTHAIWKVVKENKDLDLPTHKVMVATVRCEEIAKEKMSKLTSNKEWLELEEGSRQGAIPGFGQKISRLLDSHISGYDEEAAYFEENVRLAKRDYLVSRFVEIVQPAHEAIIGHYRTKALNRFKKDVTASLKNGAEGFAASIRRCIETVLAEFDRGCTDASFMLAVTQGGWDKLRGTFHTLKVREKLQRDLEMHADSVKTEKITELVSSFENRFSEAIIPPATSLLEAASPETWPSIRKLLAQESELATNELAGSLSGFELDKGEEAAILDGLLNYGRRVLKQKAKEEAANALTRMKDRFNAIFSLDADSIVRVWSGDEDIRAITKSARSAALGLMSVLAVMRLNSTEDGVEAALLTLLGGGAEASTSEGKMSSESSGSSLLAASAWKGVPAEEMLISPVRCKLLWRQFKTETQYTISQAILAQEASKRAKSSLPPLWAIIAMIVLGFNELMTLLRNPLYLGIMFILYLLGKAVWVQLDIGREFQAGFLPGIISVSTKLLPTLMNILKKLADEGQQNADGSTTNRPNRAGKSQAEIQMQDFSSGSSDSSTSANCTEDGSNPVRRKRQGNSDLAYS